MFSEINIISKKHMISKKSIVHIYHQKLKIEILRIFKEIEYFINDMKDDIKRYILQQIS